MKKGCRKNLHPFFYVRIDSVGCLLLLPRGITYWRLSGRTAVKIRVYRHIRPDVF